MRVVRAWLIASLFGSVGCDGATRRDAAPPIPSPSAVTSPHVSHTAPVADAPRPASSSARSVPPEIPAEKVFVRVTRLRGRRLPPPPPQGRKHAYREVVVAIRGDGRVVWDPSPDGKASLQRGRIDPVKLARWVADVRADGTLTDPAMRSYVGPDASSIEIAIDLGDQRMAITSWHETINTTRVIALSRGLVALDGQRPEDLLAREPPAYRRFLERWAGLRKSIHDLLPKVGEDVPPDEPVDDLVR